MKQDRSRKIDELVTRTMVEEKIPGISLSVVDKEGIVYSRGYGSRRLEGNLPATPDTLYGIGSCSKSFAALAVMQLVERGKVDTHDLISDHLPVDFGSREVTVHHLLTHSSGMPSLAVSELLIDRLIGMDERGTPMGSLEDFYQHLNGAVDEMREPGELFFYFNSGYTLLGELVSTLSGMPFEVFVKKNILEPLNMERSTFLEEEYEVDPDVMTPYFMDEDSPKPTPIPLRELGYAPGGLMSSVRELSSYIMMNMNGDERLLDRDLLEKMHMPYVKRPGGAYGYGWSVEEFMGHKFVGHGGSIAVSTAYVGFTPTAGIALLINTAGATSPQFLAKACLSLAEGRDHMEDVPYYTRRERMKQLTGEYHSYRGLKKARVEPLGALLKLTFLERLEKETYALVPEHKLLEGYRFHAITGDGTRIPVEFDVDERRVDLYIDRWRLHKTA